MLQKLNACISTHTECICPLPVPSSSQNQNLVITNTYTYLGVLLHSHLTYREHTSKLTKKLHQKLHVHNKIRPYLSSTVSETYLHAIVFSTISYCIPICRDGGTRVKDLTRVRLESPVLRLVTCLTNTNERLDLTLTCPFLTCDLTWLESCDLPSHCSLVKYFK